MFKGFLRNDKVLFFQERKIFCFLPFFVIVRDS